MIRILLLLAIVLELACDSKHENPHAYQNQNESNVPMDNMVVRSGRDDFDVDSFLSKLPIDARYLHEDRLYENLENGFLNGADLDSTFLYEHLAEFDLGLDNPKAEDACSGLFQITQTLELLGKPGVTLRRTSLSPDQRDEVLRIFNSPDTCDQIGISCYDPRHTLVFHDHVGRVVGFIQADFGCGNFRFSVQRSSSDDLDLCPEDRKKLVRLLVDAGVKGL
ncbi:MAG: hypothetical protein ABI432_00625 [Flavobacteriales bacterium]